jgi:hypothetical protein
VPAPTRRQAALGELAQRTDRVARGAQFIGADGDERESESESGEKRPREIGQATKIAGSPRSIAHCVR